MWMCVLTISLEVINIHIPRLSSKVKATGQSYAEGKGLLENEVGKTSNGTVAKRQT